MGPAQMLRVDTPIGAGETATRAHKGQIDLDGYPHIDHVTRVALMVPNDCVIVAWLHDVVEDTDLTFKDLRGMGLLDEDWDALDLLTRWEGWNYGSYIDRLCDSGWQSAKERRAQWVALRVKEADLIDNITRCLKDNEGPEHSLLKRYRAALIRVQTTITGEGHGC